VRTYGIFVGETDEEVPEERRGRSGGGGTPRGQGKEERGVRNSHGEEIIEE